MSIRRPSYLVLKKGKKGKLRLCFESEHKHLAEDYIRQWGGYLQVAQVEEVGVEIGSNPGPHPGRAPQMTEPYIDHTGPVPPPPGAVAPFMLAYGEDFTRAYVVIEGEGQDAEQVVHLSGQALSDVLAALDQAGGLSEEEDA